MPDLDYDRLIVLVTGVQVAAELGDRPLAYAMQGRIEQFVRERVVVDDLSAAKVVPTIVVSDALYLNAEPMQECTTLCIGGPGVNALSGVLGDRLPVAAAIDDTLVVQMDFEPLGARQALIWGMSHLDTVRAVELFVQKGYFERFVRNHLERIGEPAKE